MAHGGGGEGGGGGAAGGLLGSLFFKLGFQTETAPLERVEHLIEGVQHRLEFLGAAEVLHGIYEMTEKFSAFAETLNSSATAAGIGVEQLQGIQFAASQSAVGADQMNHALQHLSRTLNAAREGGDEATAAFEKVGITPSQLASFRNSEEAFEAISDKMMGIQDPIKKAALLQQLLGRGAGNMAMFMSKGGAAIRSLTAEAKQMGAVLSKQDVHALAEVEDALSAMGQITRTFGASIAAAFAPSIEHAVKVMMHFYAANRAVITQHIDDWVYKITYAFGFIHGAVMIATKRILEFARTHPALVHMAGQIVLAFMALNLGLGFLQKFLLGAGSAFGKLAWLLSPLLKGMRWLYTAVVWVGSALLALPLGWAIAGFAVLALGVWTLWQMFNGKKFWETDLGRALTWLRKLSGKALKLIGIDVGDIPSELEEKAMAMPLVPLVPEEIDFAEKKEKSLLDRMEDLAARFGGDIGGEGSPISRGVNLMDGAAAMADMEMPDGDWMGKQGTSSATNNVTMNADVTINAPPGADPQALGEAVEGALSRLMGRVHREAARGLKSAQVN